MSHYCKGLLNKTSSTEGETSAETSAVIFAMLSAQDHHFKTLSRQTLSLSGEKPQGIGLVYQ